MGLRKKQSKFVVMVGRLILYAESLGYELSFGDAWAKDGHIKGSFHYKRLAIDFNLFKDDKWLTKTKDHRPLGDYWKKMGGTWGGDFKRKDGNHYSFGE